MTTEPGQVYIVDLGMAAKSRPMLVVSRRDENAPRALSVCAPITTSSRGSRYEIAIGKPRFLHKASYVNLQGLQAIQHHELSRFVGRLSQETMLQVKEVLAWMFELSR
ncbi:MAG: type II toxin-antitoxin system PemK/MazF family toxin [Bacteroidetes bacterium]|nr:type II toxin-antitoxin system PemK/MazF family toxin [Bacteroidota bacterium]